jgi:hypothetical protein
MSTFVRQIDQGVDHRPELRAVSDGHAASVYGSNALGAINLMGAARTIPRPSRVSLSPFDGIRDGSSLTNIDALVAIYQAFELRRFMTQTFRDLYRSIEALTA